MGQTTLAKSSTARNSLGEFVRDFRLGEGLTQAKLASMLSVTGQYISKVETARIAMPSREFMKNLASRTGIAPEELRDLARRSVRAELQLSTGEDGRRPPSEPFKLVFGHCLWGAPILLAAHRGMIPEFSVASYSLNRGGADSQTGVQTAWIKAEEIEMDVPGPGSEDAEPWSAIKILDLLEKELIDVGAIPGNLIWGRGIYQRFMRIGTIVDSATGCTFVSPRGKLSAAGSVLSTRELFDAVLGYVGKNGARVRVAVEVGTVADNYLHRSFGQAALARQEGVRSTEAGELALMLTPERVRWHCDSRQLARKGFTELRRECAEQEDGAELLGVITWEPHASWLQFQESERESLQKFPLHFSPDEKGQLDHMSFDLVMLRTTTVSPVLRKALAKLMQKLWQNATLLSELDGTSFDMDPLRRVGTYFGFANKKEGAKLTEYDAQTVRSAIQSIRYSVHWAMESQSLFAPYEIESQPLVGSYNTV